MIKAICTVISLVALAFNTVSAQTVWLNKLDLSRMTCGWDYYPRRNETVRGTQLALGGKVYNEGIGTSPASALLINLDGAGTRFTAVVGIDDSAGSGGSAEFYVLADKRILWKSGTMEKGTTPKTVNVDLKGVSQLGLLVLGKVGRNGWADWCDARIEMARAVPLSKLTPPRDYYILTPKAPDYPRINSPKVFGVRPGDPFLFTVGASGERPMEFAAEDLPAGLKLNRETGLITGVVHKAGEYYVKLIAQDKFGKATQDFRISVGKTICLTPPMGWNSWNVWGLSVDAEKVRAAANAMVKEGLVDYGWSYVVIDGGWTIKPGSTDPLLGGQPYNSKGEINANGKFPNMKLLISSIHDKGLKVGLHTSPGPLTCGGWTASYGHERQNAERFDEWGVDYIKYDWCTYTMVMGDSSMASLQKPFLLMRRILNETPRDIVFSINPGPIGRKRHPWTWGKKVGANLWRTTGDINDSWRSMARIGFSQHYAKYAEPGHWNDPDMLVVGRLGWGISLHPSKLTPNEQYTQMSLWCLLSAPLMLGCDLNNLSPFTLNLITNNEVLAIDQDPLGREASCIYDKDGKQIWAKDIQNGSRAVGLFYVGKKKEKPADYFRWSVEKKEERITLDASQIGINGKFKVRDVWRHKNLGTFKNEFSSQVPYHGVVLLRITKIN